MADDRIVSIGLLTQRDLDNLGTAFRRQIPIDQDDIFEDLLRKLDQIEVAPLGKGVTIMPRSGDY